MRLVYFGSGEFGLPTLRALVESHEVAMVVTQPDRPAGRNRALTPTPIGQYAQQHGIAHIKPEQVNDPEIVQQIRAMNADAYVVIAFGQKLSQNLLQGVFAINLHGSLLPKYRGAAPIQWTIINGEGETGVSVIAVVDRMDAGEIYAQAATAIDPQETAGELHDRLSLFGPAVIHEVLEKRRIGRLIPQQQDPRMVTQARKLTKTDGTVHFDQAATMVRNRIHGLTPWPGCTVRLNGLPLRLARVKVIDETTEHPFPGTIQDDFAVSCAIGAIELLQVQPPGGKVMTFEAYRCGNAVRPKMKMEPL